MSEDGCEDGISPPAISPWLLVSTRYQTPDAQCSLLLNSVGFLNVTKCENHPKERLYRELVRLHQEYRWQWHSEQLEQISPSSTQVFE